MKTNIKKYISFWIISLAITDLVILFNVPVLRQVFGYLFFTLIPGWILINVLKLNQLEKLKKFILAVGLGIAFLMFGGLLANSLFFINRPLSLTPIIVVFNLIILLLIFLAYLRNRRPLEITGISKSMPHLKDKLVSPMVFSLLFPLLSILGTYLMNTYENNITLLVMLILIPVYLVAILLLRNKIEPKTYVIAIFMIGLSLVLMHSLTSNYIMGRDINEEMYVLNMTLSNNHWSPSVPANTYNACLSITILPAVYQKLLGINAENILRIVLGSFLSIIPIIIYLISRKYVSQLLAFLASLLAIFQFQFIEGQQMSGERFEISLLFFGLTLLIFLDSEIKGIKKTMLFILFGFATIVSHYSTGYILVAWIVLLWALTNIISYISHRNYAKIKGEDSFGRRLSILSITGILLFLCFLFLWYSQVTIVPFIAGSSVVKSTLANMAQLFILDSKNSNISGMLGIGLGTVPSYVNMVSNDLIILLIGIGVLEILIHFKRYRDNEFSQEYLLSVFLFFGMLAFMVILPYISTAYDPGRVFLTCIFLLAPVFIIGTKTVIGFMRHTRWLPGTLCILLLVQFACSTSLQYAIFKIPYSPYYEKNSPIRDEMYVYSGELASINWLFDNNVNAPTIFGDVWAWTRILTSAPPGKTYTIGFFDPNMLLSQATMYTVPYTNSTMFPGAYVFLRQLNVVENKILIKEQVTQDATVFTNLVNNNCDKLYTNNEASIYYVLAPFNYNTSKGK